MEPNITQPPQQAPQSVPPTAFQSVTPTQSSFQPPKNKHRLLKPLLVCLLCELLIGAGVLLYFWRDSQALEQQARDAETIMELQNRISELEGAAEQMNTQLDGIDITDFQAEQF